MVAMTVASSLPFGQALTVEDLARMPDDGHRYELIDGTLLVTPAPSWSHQRLVFAVARMLDEVVPPDLCVMTAPFDVTFGRCDTAFQPDVLVARFDAFTERNLPSAPLLVVEVRSPSTATIDNTLKSAAYARFGVPAYWLLDPIARTLIAFNLEGRSYVEAAEAGRDSVVDLTQPFPVRVNMPDLCRRLDRR